MITTLKLLFLNIFLTPIILPHLISAQCDPPQNFGLRTPKITDWEKEKYDEQSTITYECAIGHRAEIGDGLSTCVKKGSGFEWTEPDLVCQPTQCRPPARPINGRIIGSMFTFGQKIKFECDRGYKFENRFSNREVSCQADGSWSGQSPTCVEVLCPQPEQIQNGEAEFLTLRLGFSVTYKCKSGYKIEGTAERTCQENGTWSNSLPQCVVVRCPNPQTPEYKQKHGLSDVKLYIGLSPNHRVKFTCKDGKELESVCSPNGDWVPQPPCNQGDTSTTSTVDSTTILSTLLPIITTIITTYNLSTTSITEPDSTQTPPSTGKIPPGSTVSPTDATIDLTTSTPEESTGLPSWVIVLIVFASSAVLIVIVGLLVRHFLSKRKRDMKDFEKEKMDAEMESLANTKIHA